MFLAYKEDDKFQVVEFPVSLFMSAVDLNRDIHDITVADIDVFLDTGVGVSRTNEFHCAVEYEILQTQSPPDFVLNSTMKLVLRLIIL